MEGMGRGMATLGSCPPPVEEMRAQRGFIAMPREAQMWHVPSVVQLFSQATPRQKGETWKGRKVGPLPTAPVRKQAQGYLDLSAPKAAWFHLDPTAP